jgi:hypothetical protein
VESCSITTRDVICCSGDYKSSSEALLTLNMACAYKMFAFARHSKCVVRIRACNNAVSRVTARSVVPGLQCTDTQTGYRRRLKRSKSRSAATDSFNDRFRINVTKLQGSVAPYFNS